MIVYDGNPLGVDPNNTIVTKNTQPITVDDIKTVTQILSNTGEDNKQISKEEEVKRDDLLKKDTNNDGISDYESIYVYKIDPVKSSPTSTYEGKDINASDKVLLGYDPAVPELVKVTKEEPKYSVAPVVPLYKVNDVKLTKEKMIELKGQALPNSFVTIYIYSTPIMVVVKTDSNGEWKYTLDKELENGDHTVYTATVNNTGNIVAKSSGYLFTKTAEAVSFNDVPLSGASADIAQPSFLEGINIYVLVAIFIGIIITLFVLIGFISKKNNSESSPNIN
jgi:hypothetical protein